MNFTKLNVEGKVCVSASSSPRLVPNVGKLAEERDKTFVASASAALSPLEAPRLSASRFPRVSPLSARAERLKKTRALGPRFSCRDSQRRRSAQVAAENGQVFRIEPAEKPFSSHQVGSLTVRYLFSPFRSHLRRTSACLRRQKLV